jgi:hypothetical protein
MIQAFLFLSVAFILLGFLQFYPLARWVNRHQAIWGVVFLSVAIFFIFLAGVMD